MSRTERVKLAALVDLDADALLWLDAHDPEAVRALREQVADVLFEQGAGHLGGVLQASRLLPNVLVGKIGQAVFPPLLSAQLAGLLDPVYAGELVGHFDTTYLADLGAVADPRRLGHLVPHLPEDVLIAVAQELVDRGDHLTAGRLVGLAPPHLFPILVDEVAHDEALIEITFYLEYPESLDPIMACVSEERMASVMTTATRTSRWHEAITMFVFVGEANRARLARVAAGQPSATLEALVEATAHAGLWAEMLDLLAHVDDDELDGLAAVEGLSTPAVVAAAADAADNPDRRATIARLAAAMTAERRQRMAAGLASVDPARVDELVATAESLGLGPVLDWS